MSTAPSTAPPSSSAPMWSAPASCWRRRSPIGGRPEPEIRDAFRFHHISTDEVFGSLGAGGAISARTRPISRTRPIRPPRPARDHLVRAWLHTYGLPTVQTNCSNNYGPYHFPEKLIPLTILNALEGKPLPVYGTRRERARLAACRGPRRGAARGRREGQARRELQYRRRRRAAQSRGRRGDLRSRRRARAAGRARAAI